MKYLITLILFLSLLTVASADLDVVTYPTTGTFTAYSSAADLSVCQCSGAVDAIVIENTGVYSSRYSLSYNLPDYVTAAVTTVDLNPGKSTSIPIAISAPCDEEDTLELVYQVQDIFGNVATIEKNLVFGPCQNLLASLYEENVSSIKPCEPLDYSLQVTNTGTFTETYDVVFGGPDFEDYFNNPYQTVALDPAQTILLTDTLTLDCSLYGDFSIPFGVQAQKNGLVTEFVSDIVVEQDYPYNVSFAPSTLCLDQEHSIPITISTDDLDNQYAISLNAPLWAALDQKSVNISAGETASVSVLATPTETGEFPINFTVTSALGDVETFVSDVFVVEKCYDLDAFVAMDRSVVDCAGEHAYPIIINNTGTVEVPVRLDVLGHEAFSLSDQNFDLAPGVSKEVSLLVSSVESIEAKAEIIAGIVDKGSFAQDSIDIEIRSEYECYEVELVEDSYKALYSDNQVYFQTQQVGLVEDTYKVSFQSDPFLSLDLAPGAINMSPGFVLNLPIGMHADGSAALSVYGGHVVVSRQAWDNSTMEYVLPFTLNLREKSVFVRAYEYFSEHTCHFVSLLALILIIVAIFYLALRKKVQRKTMLWLIIVLAGLWLLIAAVGLSMYGTPALYDDLPESNESLEFIIGEDTYLTLDAADYFVDPDNNSLEFSVTEMENISVVIDGSFITLTPEDDFAGDRRFKIIASDGLADTKGSRMTLQVIDRPEYTLVDIYNKYCFHVNLVLLAILFVLAFFVFSPRVKKKMSARSSSTTPSPAKKTAKKSTTKKKATKKKAAKKKVSKKAKK